MMNDIATPRLRTILNVSGPISTVGIRKKKPAFACWVTFFIFHLIHWSYVETVTFLLFFFDSHFSTKEQDACSCSLVPRNWASQAEETILQMFNLFLLYPRKKSAYTRFLIKEIVRFRLSFLLIYLPSLLAEWIPWKDYFGKYSYWLAVDKHPQNISYISFAIPTSLHRCQFMQHDVLIFSF